VLSELAAPRLTVIDFSQVGLLDFSCADEVVGKLVNETGRRAEAAETYFVIRGVRDDHFEAIESAMARYDCAILVERDDSRWQVVGRLDDRPRRALELMLTRGRAEPSDLAAELEESPDDLEVIMQVLCERKLVMRDETAYVSLPNGL
jgi:hypothetical protein